jgi:exonuclease III
VPNSGQKLERLEYRTQQWDLALRAYVAALESEGKPVIITGDLNVAHL